MWITPQRKRQHLDGKYVIDENYTLCSTQSTFNHGSQLLVDINKRGFQNNRLFDMQGLISGLLAFGIVTVDGCTRPPPRPPPPRPGKVNIRNPVLEGR